MRILTHREDGLYIETGPLLVPHKSQMVAITSLLFKLKQIRQYLRKLPKCGYYIVSYYTDRTLKVVATLIRVTCIEDCNRETLTIVTPEKGN